jgi:Fe-Mn family superoxide dismutase
MMTRRDAVKTTLLTTAAISVCAPPARLLGQGAAPAGPFHLPPLPYAFDALEPHIDARTMEIHHDRHHQTYVNNLNKALEAHPTLATKTIEELLRHIEDLPEAIRTAVRNSGGGHANHTLFWQMMKKGGGGEPTGALAKGIDRKFGGFAKFKEEFSATATKVFGSGWGWLVLEDKDLKIVSTPNQDTPLSQGRVPLLGLDVWEHAYYLKYQNKRADYIAAFFQVINWDFVTTQFERRHA